MSDRMDAYRGHLGRLETQERHRARQPGAIQAEGTRVRPLLRELWDEASAEVEAEEAMVAERTAELTGMLRWAIRNIRRFGCSGCPRLSGCPHFDHGQYGTPRKTEEEHGYCTDAKIEWIREEMAREREA